MPSALDLEQAVADLGTVAQSDLDALWREVDSALAARDALLAVVPAVLTEYGSAAAAFAADWYDETRVEVGALGRFTAIPATLDRVGADELVRWGVSPLFRGVAFDLAVQSAMVLVEGGMRRRIANASRDTITTSSVQDPAARGWQRGGKGDCAFCTMLIARGVVYTRETVDFAAHDHCNCYAVPAWRGEPVPVRPYRPTLRNVTDADRERVREYLRINGY